jgi:hypothetical protein
MASSSVVKATLAFSTPVPNGERAYTNINADPETGVRKTNVVRFHTEVNIENLRGKEDSVTLDTAGFQFYAGRPATHKSFNDDKEIEAEYYPESAELIKELTGASRVVFFDHSKFTL